MHEMVRHIIDLLSAGYAWRAIPEMLLYAIGLAIFFYFVDVLFMRWQGLALH